MPAPTLELSIYFRRPLPFADMRDDSYVLGAFRTRLVHGGFLEEDGELWTEDGVLLAQSRQLALLVPAMARRG